MMYRGQINTEVDRPDSSLAASLEEFDVPTLHEVHKAVGGWSLLSPGFRCMPDSATCVGVAVTALLPEGDNMGVSKLLGMTQPGDVMVMNTVQSSGRTGLFGDLMGITARARGVKGVVANGTIRDVQTLRRSGLPLWFRGVNAMGMIQRTIAGINVPIALGGVIVRPGALIVADSDGILVLEPTDVPEIVERAHQRRAYERSIVARLEAGETAYDVRHGEMGVS
jgi:4-hydroxy-4-methyl-2-oxoglutarate aldolase